MGWFKRHLNATTLIYTFYANVAGYLLAMMVGRITDVPYWGRMYYSNAIDVLLPVFSSFYFDMHLIFATLLAMIGFGWVLKQKIVGRSI